MKTVGGSAVRVAAFDCGTNSLRLLIADVYPSAGRLTDVERCMEIVRLGEGVDATGTIRPEAMARALDVTARYARLCDHHGVGRARFVATSASRDARNAAEFVRGVRDLLGVDPEVISGTEEAHLSFVGATRGLPGAHQPPYLVVDLGGGSTEFVRGRADVEAALSVDVGCVRLTERHLRSDPPTGAEIADARRLVTEQLDLVDRAVDLSRTATLVGLAGSVTTITAHALRLPTYDSMLVHGAALPIGVVRAACVDLLALPRRARLALPYMHPGRADVIGAGALIWDLIVERVAGETSIAQVIASEHDILDGIAWSAA